jgi:alpha-glucosidase (family GH31 glycosyl hydrolase)
MVLWIGPFVNGKMAQEAFDKGYGIPGQSGIGTGGRAGGGGGNLTEGTNYPLIDFTNPAAKAFFEDGVAKLLKLGVAGFKLDRSEENLPADNSVKLANGETFREMRNVYPALYLQATYDVAKKYRGDDFVAMPRAAYTGSAPYGVYWGGDIGGTPEGLRASIIAVQRCAVMGYPVWGSDTGGYNQQTADQDLYSRWLEFSCFTPIMEVGPTHNVAFWSLPRQPTYDDVSIAVWRLYARLHTRLADYSFAQGKVAHDTGLPIVRPLFMVDPKAPAAWTNWWTYQYGPDLLVSPIWERGKTTQEVYLPAGNKWRYVWTDKEYDGGQTVTVDAAIHQMPLFVRVGANLPLGDLAKEWSDSQTIAKQQPNLVPLDAEVKAWFDKYSAHRRTMSRRVGLE